MPRILKNIASSTKRTAFNLLMSAVRTDRTGAREVRLQSWLTAKFSAKRHHLRSLAWLAEERDDAALAIVAWNRVADNLANKSASDYIKTLKRIAHLEIDLRRRVEAAGGRVLVDGPDLPTSGARAGDGELSPYLLETRHAFLTRYWGETVPAMSERRQTTIRRIYNDLAAGWAGAGQYGDSMLALEPVLTLWPDKQTGYLQYHRNALSQVFAQDGDAARAQEGWWALFDQARDRLTEPSLTQIWDLTEKMARKLITRKRPVDAERVIAPAFSRWPENYSALVVLAQAAEQRGQWALAASHWQLMASITNPITTKTLTHVAENPEEMLRRSRFAQNALRGARFRLAGEMFGKGRKREFAELVCRAVETIPDQRVFKKERDIIDLVRLYVQDALAADGIKPRVTAPADNKPLKIMVCLDILKVSDVHTHSRVVFAMCRNLMRLDPRIETHIVVTNERFAVTTPVVSSSFNPNMEDMVQEVARAALPEYHGSRFFLHNLKSIGLEGLIDTCKTIIGLAPDVILYGGGHLGLFSNESRVVRHCLYDHFPSAFFYIQANNEVDDKLDLIIARGPHEVLGEHGHKRVKVREQPYPTIVDATIPEIFEPEKQENKIIVSAITGVRMNVKMSEQNNADLALFFSMLDKNPGTVWHFIGSSDPEAMIAGNPQIAKRVKSGQVVVHPVLPFDEFCEFVGKKASMFLHLPGFTGGSGGATVARRAGIPILTFKHSDVSGRQPPETVFDPENTKGYVQLAMRLLRSKSEWERIVRLQFAHTKWILETSGQGFYDCLTETVAIGTARRDPRIVRMDNKNPDKKPKLSVVKNTA